MAITGGKAGLALGKEWPGRVSGVCSADGVVAAGTLCGAVLCVLCLGLRPWPPPLAARAPSPDIHKVLQTCRGFPGGVFGSIAHFCQGSSCKVPEVLTVCSILFLFSKFCKTEYFQQLMVESPI